MHDFQGDDLFHGTFEKPMKTIQAALSLTRTLRAVRGRDSTLCITIRGGTYYLGTNATTTSSRIGAIALTSNDSNIVIENYQNEQRRIEWWYIIKTAMVGSYENSSGWYNYESTSATFRES